MLQTKEFYNLLSQDYDLMTNFNLRMEKEKKTFEEIIKKFQINSAIDAGCGTGLHSVILSQLGIQVISCDISDKMIAQTKMNAKKFDVKLQTCISDFKNITKKISKKVDAIFCLANSLPHLLKESDLQLSLKNFFKLLNKNGTLFIHTLNYKKILNSKNRIQFVRKRNEKTFVRFFDFINENLIHFNILNLDGEKFSLKTISQNPIRKNFLEKNLKLCGFENIKSYGNLSFEKFQNNLSNDLIIVAKKCL